MTQNKYWGSNSVKVIEDTCVIETPQILEREVCATIDWVSQKYELIRLYTRNETTWAMTIVWYEDTFGNPITWVVVETCCDCSAICYGSVIAPIANRRSDSYGAFTAQYQTWLDNVQYDDTYIGRWPVGSPRNHYYTVKVYNDSNSLLSTTVLWPYAVNPSNSTYLQFLSDLSALTSSVWVTFPWVSANVWWRGGYQIEYNNTTGFSIILEHWIDNHAGWVIRNPDIKQAIRYESSRAEVRDSVMPSWDLNNPAADAGWREWSTVAFPNDNVTII